MRQNVERYLIIRNMMAENGQELTPEEAKKLEEEITALIDIVTPDFAIYVANMPDVDEDTLDVILHINRIKAQR
jgi:hypothetical protein